MIQYCIIDDEPIAHRIIEGYSENLPYIQKAGNCFDAFEAMQFLSKNTVDLIFLDINMPKLTGFELLKTLINPPKIIVTSAHKEFALEGYDFNIVDYLLKPFTFERFIRAVNKAIENQTFINTNSKPSNKGLRFFLKGDKKHHQIHTDDILFVEAYGNYSKVYLNEEMIVSHEKISSLEHILPNDSFIRVHKSFIVSTHKIKSIEGNRITINEHTIPVGQTYKNNLRKLYSS